VTIQAAPLFVASDAVLFERVFETALGELQNALSFHRSINSLRQPVVGRNNI